MIMQLEEHINLTAGLICQYCPRMEVFLIGFVSGVFVALFAFTFYMWRRNRYGDAGE